MPATEYDKQFRNGYAHEHDVGEHAHFVGTDYESAARTKLGHGSEPQRLYAIRGDWYAVHTH